MPSGSWSSKGVSIQSSELTDPGYAYQSLYQPVQGTYQNQHQNHHHSNQEQQQQLRDGFSLESHHFMDLSRVLKEVEDEGSLIPSPTRLLDRKRRLSDDVDSPSSPEDLEGNVRHASIEQIKNNFSISLDSLNDNNIEVSCRRPQESFRINYDSDQTPTVDKSFWSESDDDSPVVEGDSCYFDDTNSDSYNLPSNTFGRLLTPSNINDYLVTCDQDIEKELHNIGVVTQRFDEDNEIDEDSVEETRSCSSHDATSTASSGSLRSAYSLQTPALSSSPESYDMLYRSFEVASMIDNERKKNGVDISDSDEESPLDALNKTSPKLQRMSYHRGIKEESDETNSGESSPSLLRTPDSDEARAAQNEASFTEQPSFTLDFPSAKSQLPDDLSSSKVITFAQIAQQRKRPAPREPKRRDESVQENQLHWTELLSNKSSSASSTPCSQDIPGAGAQCESQEGLPDAPRRPQSLPIQLRHLQKPLIRLHATPPRLPLLITRTLSAPEGVSTSQRRRRTWGEHDEGIGELSESEVEDLTPDPVTLPSPLQAPIQSLSPLLRQDEIEFAGLPPRRHRTTTWCGSFGAARRSLLSSREHLSDTDSLDSWQPSRPKDINANLPSSSRSRPKDNARNVSALYNARSISLDASVAGNDCSSSSRESVQRTRKRHFCKDTYAERMLQHGGVFINGTENKPFLLQNIDSKDKAGVASLASKTHSLPRNMGVTRRRSVTSGGRDGGKSRPKSMEGLSTFSSGFFEVGDQPPWMQNLATLGRSKSEDEPLVDTFCGKPEDQVVDTSASAEVVPGVSAAQQRWNEADAADYASLNSSLLRSSLTCSSPPPISATQLVRCEETKVSSVIPSVPSSEQCSILPASASSTSRIIRIDNVAKDAEVKYIKHRPLKPIHVVDAEHHRKKVLERLSVLQPPCSAPPTGIKALDWKNYAHPTAATKTGATNSQATATRGHRRQKSDASASVSQSLIRSESFWTWAIGRQQPGRGRRMTSAMEDSTLTSAQQASRLAGLRSQIRPLALNVAHDDWDTLDAMPPQVMEVSPRTQQESIAISVAQKRALVAGVNAAVDQLLAHFAKAKSGMPEEKARLGNTWKTPDVGHLALHYLCPALMSILQDGLRPHCTSLLVGRIKNSTWTTVEATTQIGPGTRLLHELALTVTRDIRLKDSKLRTHAFFLGLLNIRCVETWLDHIKSHPDSIKRLYEPSAFLTLCTTAGPYKQLFDDLLVAVQPLAQLPFNLDHGFEYGSIQAENMRQRERQQLMEQHKETAPTSSLNTNSLVDARLQSEGGSASSGISVNLFGRPSRRDRGPSQRPVSTGMYSSMTVNRNARRVTPVGRQESSEQPTDAIRAEGLLRTVNSTPAGHEFERAGGVSPRRGSAPQAPQSNRWSLGWIKDFATSVSATPSDRVASRIGTFAQPSTSEEYHGGSENRRSKSVDMQAPVQGLSSAITTGWGKLGASFSKMWNNVTPVQPTQTPQEAPKPLAPTPPPPVTPGLEVRQGGDGQSPCQYYSPNATPGTPVKALCHHVTMSEGELCFSKGDVLTVNKQVDHDWLLCSHGNESGLVHIEYVQGLE